MPLLTTQPVWSVRRHLLPRFLILRLQQASAPPGRLEHDEPPHLPHELAQQTLPFFKPDEQSVIAVLSKKESTFEAWIWSSDIDVLQVSSEQSSFSIACNKSEETFDTKARPHNKARMLMQEQGLSLEKVNPR